MGKITKYLVPLVICLSLVGCSNSNSNVVSVERTKDDIKSIDTVSSESTDESSTESVKIQIKETPEYTEPMSIVIPLGSYSDGETVILKYNDFSDGKGWKFGKPEWATIFDESTLYNGNIAIDKGNSMGINASFMINWGYDDDFSPTFRYSNVENVHNVSEDYSKVSDTLWFYSGMDSDGKYKITWVIGDTPESKYALSCVLNVSDQFTEEDCAALSKHMQDSVELYTGTYSFAKSLFDGSTKSLLNYDNASSIMKSYFSSMGIIVSPDLDVVGFDKNNLYLEGDEHISSVGFRSFSYPEEIDMVSDSGRSYALDADGYVYSMKGTDIDSCIGTDFVWSSDKSDNIANIEYILKYVEIGDVSYEF